VGPVEDFLDKTIYIVGDETVNFSVTIRVWPTPRFEPLQESKSSRPLPQMAVVIKQVVTDGCPGTEVRING